MVAFTKRGGSLVSEVSYEEFQNRHQNRPKTEKNFYTLRLALGGMPNVQRPGLHDARQAIVHFPQVDASILSYSDGDLVYEMSLSDKAGNPFVTDQIPSFVNKDTSKILEKDIIPTLQAISQLEINQLGNSPTKSNKRG